MKASYTTTLVAAAAIAGFAFAASSFGQTAPDSMLYEIVQTDPDIGAIPPNAQDGFGSTNGGALGTINIQKYVRIAGASGNSIIGEWLSAGDDVAPLLAGPPFNIDSIYAEFRDNNTYTVKQVDKAGVTLLLEGTYASTPSGVGNINNIVVNQSSPVPLTAQGIYEILTVTTGIEEKSSVPEAFVLHQNYPNPFNPSTRIAFSIPRNSRVTVNVFNTLGQEVATLVDGYLLAGSHVITFDGANLPTGIYLYRLQTGDLVSIKRMVLVK